MDALIIWKAALIAGSYVIGSIPTGLLISKGFYGLDVRLHGSGNPGATNVWRVLGARAGASTLTLDIMKGVVPVLIGRMLVPKVELWPVLAGLAAIAGHNWSLFLNFKGGKGVATSAGVFLALLPIQTGIALLGFLLIFGLTRHVSVGSMGAAVILLITTYTFPVNAFLQVVIVAASAMLLIKHIPNIKRLAQGTEPKVSFKK